MENLTVENVVTYREFEEIEQNISSALNSLISLQNYYGLKSASESIVNLELIEDKIFDARKAFDKKRIQS